MLDRITLSRFRNHAETSLDGSRHLNLLLGENGAGKTNILEALSLFAPGRGLRRTRPAEMAWNAGEGGFAIGSSLVGLDEPVRLATYTDAASPGRRNVQINGAPSPATSLGEWVAISWLTPTMDGLFADSAGARRRYMDRLAVALDPLHARYSTRYEAALRERNRLLSGDETPDPAWLEGIEAQMAEYGSALADSRARLVAALTDTLSGLPDQPFARPALVYEAGGPLQAEDLTARWREARQRDRAAGRTLSGPHRDELGVSMSRTGMPAADCSTGEQKAMLIAITLAHADLAARGRPGILLLDEVAAHLDPKRRGALFERLADGQAQVWMTGTEPAPFEGIVGSSAYWRVAEGSVRKVD